MTFESAILGETREQKTISRSNLYYRGQKIPWIIHDCCGSNCGFCKKQKRLFAAQLRKEAGE